MSMRDDLDLRLTAWFDADAVAREPEHLLEHVLARTARTRRRPAWAIPERWIPVDTILTATAPRSRVPWRAVVVLALLLLSLVVGYVLYAGSHPRLPNLTGPAGNGQIVYISDGTLYSARPNGSDARPLLPAVEVPGLPVFSRDGTRLAFLTYADPSSATSLASLHVAKADGSQRVPIITGARTLGFFSFSPDGTQIAFSRWIDDFDGQLDRIFIAPSDGSAGPVQIGTRDMSAFNPAFSPDGHWIAFQSDHCLTATTPQSECVFALHVMRPDGTDVREVTRGVGTQFFGNGFENRTWGVEWSPDSARILVTRAETSNSVVTSGLYLVPLGGGTAVQIADGPGSEYGASWAPTGDRIAFLRRDEVGRRLAYVVNADGSGERLVATAVAGLTPQWSPDGRWLAVVAEIGGSEGQIRLIRLDGSAPDVVVRTVLIPTASETTPGIDAIAWQRIAP